MKKYLLLILSVLLTVTSCNTVSPIPAETQSSIMEESTAPAETAAPMETTAPEAPAFDGIFATDLYSVHEINGTYYLNFTDGNHTENGSSSNTVVESSVPFSSIAEMKEKILSGSLDEASQRIIKQAFEKNENGILMFNLGRLFQPVVPSELSQATVYWSGDTYGVIQSGAQPSGHPSAYFYFYPTETYETFLHATFEGRIHRFESDEEKEVVSHEQGTFDGLPCDIYVLKTSVARLCVIHFEIPGENGEPAVRVSMDYRINYFGPLDNVTVSTDVPQSITMFGTEQEQGYKIYITNPTSAPTLEWLSSFGITPFVDSTDQEIS